MAKYTMVYIYTKKGNLMEYFYAMQRKCDNPAAAESLRKMYEAEREIQLIAMFRWEHSGMGIKHFCKIKCPVNPMPVKGEFEIPSVGALIDFLKKNGWNYKRAIYPLMFE